MTGSASEETVPVPRGEPLPMRYAKRYGPGLALVVSLAAVARVSAGWLPSIANEVTIGVLVGIAAANVVGVPEWARPGVTLSFQTLLRIGVALLGARLAFTDVIQTGAGALSVVVVGMLGVLVFTILVGHLLGLPGRLTLLIAVGTAVCGNSAIAATAPVVRADGRDVSFAVATITTFGIIAVLAYPFLGHLLGMSDVLFGHWVGAAVNDTSQVTAAGFAYSAAAGEAAIVVKLTRNTLMGPLILAIGIWYARFRAPSESRLQSGRMLLLRAVPPFVVGFLILAVANTAGLIPKAASAALQDVSQLLILLALVGVGLSADMSRFRDVGWRPFCLGLVAASLLSVAMLTMFASARME